YNNFLLIISYWIAPWLAVMFCDMYLRARRRESPDVQEHLLFNRKYTNWAGPVAMAVGVGVSIWLFSNQTKYIRVVPAHWPAAGDVTFEVGFVLTAIIYVAWRLIADSRTGARAAASGLPGPGRQRLSRGFQRLAGAKGGDQAVAADD